MLLPQLDTAHGLPNIEGEPVIADLAYACHDGGERREVEVVVALRMLPGWTDGER